MTGTDVFASASYQVVAPTIPASAGGGQGRSRMSTLGSGPGALGLPAEETSTGSPGGQGARDSKTGRPTRGMVVSWRQIQLFAHTTYN